MRGRGLAGEAAAAAGPAGEKNYLGNARGAKIATLICAAAIWAQSFWLLCFGTLVFGVYNAYGQYYRFAAADVASGDFKAVAISLVLAGGLVGGAPTLRQRCCARGPAL